MSILSVLIMTCGALLTEPPPFQDQLSQTPGFQALEVPAELAEVVEASLPASLRGQAAKSAGVLDASEEMGERLLLFTLAPRQRVTFRLVTSGGDSLKVQIGAANTNHPLQSILKSLSRLPPMMRAQKMEVPNGTEAPQRVLLKLTGQKGIAYKITVKREAL